MSHAGERGCRSGQRPPSGPWDHSLNETLSRTDPSPPTPRPTGGGTLGIAASLQRSVLIRAPIPAPNPAPTAVRPSTPPTTWPDVHPSSSALQAQIVSPTADATPTPAPTTSPRRTFDLLPWLTAIRSRSETGITIVDLVSVNSRTVSRGKPVTCPTRDSDATRGACSRTRSPVRTKVVSAAERDGAPKSSKAMALAAPAVARRRLATGSARLRRRLRRGGPGRRLEPAALGHDLRLLGIRLVGGRHDLDPVLVEHVLDVTVQGCI